MISVIVISIVNNAAVTLGQHLCKMVILFHLDECSAMGLLASLVLLFLTFLGACILFSIETVLIYIPTNSVPGFTFLQILTNTCYFLSF